MWKIVSDILSNEWVVGIGGGIISGIIVYFITTEMFRRKEKRKHIEQIDRANMDIIRSLRAYIVEKGLPDKEIIDALILSTARKYKFKTEELYSIRIICEELIREIIENVYVSMEKKQYYTEQLKEYLDNLNSAQNKAQLISDIEKEIVNITQYTKTEYQERTITMLGIMAGIMTTVVSGISMVEKEVFTAIESLGNKEPILIAIVVSVMVIGILLVLMRLLEFYTGFKKNDKENKDDDE